MRRFGKILCGFGSLEFLGAVLAFTIFEHLPYPWGMGTMTGGLGEQNHFEAVMNIQAHVIGVLFGLALLGVVFLLVGAIAFLLSAVKESVSWLQGPQT